MKASASLIEAAISRISPSTSTANESAVVLREPSALALRLCFRNITWSLSLSSTGSILDAAFFIDRTRSATRFFVSRSSRWLSSL